MSATRFFAGDERGRIHAYTASHSHADPTIVTQVACSPSELGRDKSVGLLALTRDQVPLLACTRADASVSLYALEDDQPLRQVAQWSHPKIHSKAARFVALDSLPGRGIITATSTGQFALNTIEGETTHSRFLAPSLKDLRVSHSGMSFTTGGDEVELSTWDLEASLAVSSIDDNAAQSQPPSKKRKKDDPLQAGETWRAKNVPYDNLNLRVPVHITSLCYAGNGIAPHDLATGTNFGTVRRYDTRGKRRPAADWSSVIPKNAAVRRVERGVSEHDLFVTDERGQLFALDLRTGKQLYSYKGIGGTVTSFASNTSSQPHIFSASMDRYVRLHTTAMPPAQAGRNMDGRGETVAKLYTQDVVTAVCFDSRGVDVNAGNTDGDGDEAADVGDEIWDQLRDVDEDEDATAGRRKRRKA